MKCKKKIWQTMMDIIILDFLMFCQFFYSPQVERSVIICNKYGIYEFSHNLPSHLRLGILGNYNRSTESPNIIEL